MGSEPVKPLGLPCRRQTPRQRVRLAAFVRAPDSVGWYAIRDLSVGGAALAKGPALATGARVEVALHSTLVDPIRLGAHVIYAEGGRMGISFLHRDETEDAIQALLLAELERDSAQSEKNTA